jgi:hypothetical protein
MNLMIGLAVENIQDIKDNAEFKKLSDQVGILYIHKDQQTSFGNTVIFKINKTILYHNSMLFNFLNYGFYHNSVIRIRKGIKK